MEFIHLNRNGAIAHEFESANQKSEYEAHIVGDWKR